MRVKLKDIEEVIYNRKSDSEIQRIKKKKSARDELGDCY